MILVLIKIDFENDESALKNKKESIHKTDTF